MEAIQLPANHTEISNLQARIAAAFEQLVMLSKQIQKVAVENEQLRSENAVLLDRFLQ